MATGINRAPSVARLMKIDGMTQDTAAEIRAAIHSMPSDWRGIFRNHIDAARTILEMVPNTHGMEAIFPRFDCRNIQVPNIRYANTGETYGTTLLFLARNGTASWSVGSWGGIVERYPPSYD